MNPEKLHTEYFGKEYYKNLCKNLRLSEDFLELDAFDYMLIYFKLLHELCGDSVTEEQFKEQVLNELQSLGLKTTKED